MAGPDPDDGSRIEAAEAGVHAEQREIDEPEVPGAHDHVDATDAVRTPAAGPVDALDVTPHVIEDTSDTAVGIGDHGPAPVDVHPDHGPAAVGVHADDDHGGAHGHGADPNAGVVIGTPPTPAWVMTAAGIGLVTILVCIVLAVMLHDVSVGS